MLRSAFGRRIISEASRWRCVLQTSANFSTRSQPPLSSPTSALFVSSTTASNHRLLSVRPVRWHLSRHCQGDSPASSNTGNTKEGLSLGALAQAPKPALVLGFSGLLPFVCAPLLMASQQYFLPEVAYAQVLYGASIVSFLGGARWGFALPVGSPAQPDWMNLGNSVIPSLLAWLAMLCKDNIVEGALIVIMGLGLSLHYDLILLPGYPAWFKAMRTILSLIATFSLVATLTIKQYCTEKKLKELKV